MKRLWRRSVDEDWWLAIGVFMALGCPAIAQIVSVFLK